MKEQRAKMKDINTKMAVQQIIVTLFAKGQPNFN